MRLCRPSSLTARSLWALAGGAVLLPSCLAQPEGLAFVRPKDADAGAPPVTFLDASPREQPRDDSALERAPHSLRTVDPSHGPFPGGGRALLRGTGFGSDARVWFGSVELPADQVVAVDRERIQVTVPAGRAGLVDVAVQNGSDASTRVVLPGGYVYDPVYVSPASGPVSGGTVITLRGDVAGWSASTTVLVDGKPCEVIEVRAIPDAPDELDCRTPAGTPGAKQVSVVDGTNRIDLLDAFVYGDSENGFRGGLSGNPRDGADAPPLRVIVLNGLTGRAVPAATVVLGTEVTEGNVHLTDANGVLVVAPGTARPTVTIAGPCLMPTTFIDVPVDTVTAYLDPVLSPSCTSNGTFTGVGSSGGGGGSTRSPARVAGELVWPQIGEFQRGQWDTPSPATPEARSVAYVFEFAREPDAPFRLPSASAAVTPQTEGRAGYGYSVPTNLGSVALYALAGVEDRSRTPPVFTAYTAGVAAPVVTEPGEELDEVFIEMNIPLDHALTLDVTGPTPTERGPDRLVASVAVRVGALGFLVLPVGSRTTLLPATAPLGFVGLPPLVGGLSGAEYLLTASASSGESATPPRSVLGRIATTTSGLLTVDGFLEVPRLTSPATNEAWDGRRLTVAAAPGGPEADLLVLEIQSGGGLATWTIVAPGATSDVRVPDLRALGGLGLPSGPLSIVISRATIQGFDYGSLRYGSLTSRGWRAYATDVVQARL